MSGLRKLCKLYGSIKINNKLWVWDYANDKLVLKSEMTSKQFAESEKAKWMQFKK